MRYSEEEIKIIKHYAAKHPRKKAIKVAELLFEHFPNRSLVGLAAQVDKYRAPSFLTKNIKWLR
jgi:hypothetical protein